MGMQRALEFCGGAVAVYLAMVACSAGSAGRAPVEGSAGAQETTGSAGQAVALGGEGGLLGGGYGGAESAAGGSPGAGSPGAAGLFTDPTPDAGAQEAGAGPGPGTCECPEPPIVPEEIVWEEHSTDCETFTETGNLRFAKVNLPGVSADRLARAVVVSLGGPAVYAQLGFDSFATTPLIGDEMLGMQCTSGEITGARFLVPSR